MLRVRNLDEAILLAKELCRRHEGLVQSVGPTNTARDIATRILLEELQSGEPTANELRSRNAPPAGSVLPRKRDPTSPTSHTAPTLLVTSGNKTLLAEEQQSLLEGRLCPYCTEPTSRYCKETGRRHQTQKERLLFLWKRLYRHYSLASQFVTAARLAKKNTCVEDYTVELDF